MRFNCHTSVEMCLTFLFPGFRNVIRLDTILFPSGIKVWAGASTPASQLPYGQIIAPDVHDADARLMRQTI